MTEHLLRGAVTRLERQGVPRAEAWLRVNAGGLTTASMLAAEKRRLRQKRLASRAHRRHLEAQGLCITCGRRPSGEASRCPACARKRAKKLPTSCVS